MPFQHSSVLPAEAPDADYAMLERQAQALMRGEPSLIANLANLSALLFEHLPNINWCGCYLYDGRELVLGPFQGKVACVRIALGRGVCGQAAQSRQVLRVHDVHQFEGHIACDAASRSEIVVPLLWQDQLVGVWDVDSPLVGRFSQADEDAMIRLCRIVLECSDPEVFCRP